jgi:hypothetical protein
MITEIIILVVVAVGAFVAGVLVGKANKKVVSSVVDDAHKIVSSVKQAGSDVSNTVKKL